MKSNKFNAVSLKRYLQKKVEQKLLRLSEKEQLALLSKKFGHLIRRKAALAVRSSTL